MRGIAEEEERKHEQSKGIAEFPQTDTPYQTHQAPCYSTGHIELKPPHLGIKLQKVKNKNSRQSPKQSKHSIYRKQKKETITLACVTTTTGSVCKM